ncbi:MAG: polysaccharide deacetylase family protein [Fuerstiella sp.]
MLSLITIMRKNPRKAGLIPGEVVLTFDDGPNLKDNVTPRLLDVLDQHSVKAGFCVVGEQVHQHPDVVSRMYDSGHLLINHTQRHEHPFRQSYETLLNEILECDQEIAAALGIPDYRSEFFRAPFGIVTFAVRRVTRNLKMTPVLLSHYGWDTRVGPHNCQPIVDLLIQNAKRHQGGMFVFHDGSLVPPKVLEDDWRKSVENRSWVPDAVDEVITELKKHGLHFVLPGQSAVQSVDVMKAAA